MQIRKSGYVAVSAAVGIGALLWYARPDFRIAPQDVAELMNGTQERCLATRFWTNEVYSQPVIVSNGQYSVVTGGDDDYSFFAGTNSVPYSLPVLEEVPPYTNTLQVGLDYMPWPGAGGERLSYNPVAIETTFIEHDPTNRWILGTYDSFVISGFVQDEFNGVYRRRYSGSDYTNSAGNTMIVGEVNTIFYQGEYYGEGDTYEMAFPPWFGGTVVDTSYWTHDPLFPDFTITCLRGPVSGNIIDRPCYRKTYVYDWTIGNSAPGWNELFGSIDSRMLGAFNDGEHTRAWGWFSGWLYSPMARPALTNSVQDYHPYQHFYDHAFFVNSAKWSCSSFTNLADLEIDVPGLGLTNHYDVACAGFTQRVYAADDVLFTSNQWYYTTAPGPQANRMLKRSFDQRLAALRACTVLRMHGGKARWLPPDSTNNVRWSGTVSSTVSYSDACEQARAACTNYGTEAGAPYSWCWASMNPGTPPRYNVSMRSRDARLVMFLDTNNQCEASTYVRARRTEINYAPPANRSFADDSGAGLITNVFVKIDQVPACYRFAYTNVVVTNSNSCFPLEPVASGYDGTTACGYTLEGDQDAEVITKWDFKFCRP